MYRTKIERSLIPVIYLITALVITACQTQSSHSRQYLQFGTLIEITLASTTEQQSNSAFAAIEALLIQRHSDWHGWEDGSLTAFNKALAEYPERGTEVPQNLKRLISDSKKYFNLSGGLFNPALGKLIGAWGFHEHTEPDLQLIDKIKQDIPGMNDLVIKNQLAYSTNPHLQLDFGAIAKGLAILEIRQLLLDQGIHNFIINAGGDINVAGNNGSRNWRVAIQDPFKEDIIGSVELAPSQSIFTSGNYRRYYEQPEHKRRHHIINPKTGEPSLFISSATVMHPDPVLSDVAATTLMLGTQDQIKTLANALGIQKYMVITEQREVIISQPMYDDLAWHNQQQFNIQLQ